MKRALAAEFADHPRSRGVYLMGRRIQAAPFGSSPLARGLPGGRGQERVADRIIPARAGFTPEDDHALPYGGGSSPLARGLRGLRGPSVGGLGIIPARAGFTKSRSRARRPCADHPRSRGVYAGPLHRSGHHRGSSPLARGLPEEFIGAVKLPRIIPARAGFTLKGSPSGPGKADHPRSRGVYSAAATALTAAAGSSPLARGLPEEFIRAVKLPRIIPARAGFTAQHRLRPEPDRDHPRSRGVYSPSWRPPLFQTGSSPLARGLPADLDDEFSTAGIIPARAGFTAAGGRRRSRWTDHPRSRGVYPNARVKILPVLGSSPLARGLHLRIPGIPTTSHTTRPRLPSLPT